MTVENNLFRRFSNNNPWSNDFTQITVVESNYTKQVSNTQISILSTYTLFEVFLMLFFFFLTLL